MILTDLDRLLPTTILMYANKQVAKFLRTSFQHYTSGWLLQTFVEYFSLEFFCLFVSLDKFVLHSIADV